MIEKHNKNTIETNSLVCVGRTSSIYARLYVHRGGGGGSVLLARRTTILMAC